MSRKRTSKAKRFVKCAYCGREDVLVTAKGYMKPHVKTDGRPCLFGNIPFTERIVTK